MIEAEATPIDSGTVAVPDGRVVAWTEWGAPGGAVVAVQPHIGVSGDRLLEQDAAPLRDAGIRVIRITRAGLGRSTPNPRKTVLTDADDMARALAFLGHKRQIDILAECGGSGVGLAFAAAWPDRVRSVVVLSGAAPLRSMRSKELNKLMNGIRTAFRFRFLATAISRTQSRSFMKDPDASLDRGWAALPEPDRRFGDDPVRRAFGRREAIEFYQSPEAIFSEWSIIANRWRIDWSAIRARVIISHGDLDTTMPVSMARWLAGQLPHADLRIDPQRGHLFDSAKIAELLAEVSS